MMEIKHGLEKQPVVECGFVRGKKPRKHKRKIELQCFFDNGKFEFDLPTAEEKLKNDRKNKRPKLHNRPEKLIPNQ